MFFNRSCTVQLLLDVAGSRDREELNWSGGRQQLQRLRSSHGHSFVRYVLALYEPQYLLLFYLVYFSFLDLKRGMLMQFSTHQCNGNTEQLPKCLCRMNRSVWVQGTGHDCKWKSVWHGSCIIKMPHISLCMGHFQHLSIIMNMMEGGSYLHNLLDVKAGREN